MNLAQKLAIWSIGITSSLPFAYSVPKAIAQEKEVKQQTAPEKTSSELTLEQIAEEVKKPVEEILKGVPVTYLTPDDYETEVYQTNVSPEQKKPVLVLFYESFVPEAAKAQHGTVFPDRRLAIVVRELAKLYQDKIKFCAIDDAKNANPVLSDLARKEGLTGMPSLAMYSPFDLVKGETPQKNDGRMKQSDILRGGPTADKWISNWVTNCSESWIASNIFNKYAAFSSVTRYLNAGELKPVKFEK